MYSKCKRFLSIIIIVILMTACIPTTLLASEQTDLLLHNHSMKKVPAWQTIT